MAVRRELIHVAHRRSNGRCPPDTPGSGYAGALVGGSCSALCGKPLLSLFLDAVSS